MKNMLKVLYNKIKGLSFDSPLMIKYFKLFYSSGILFTKIFNFKNSSGVSSVVNIRYPSSIECVSLTCFKLFYKYSIF